METTLVTLTIVLSIATLLLLILVITAAVLAVKILKAVKQLIARAQESADTVAAVVDQVRDSVENPSIIATIVTKIINNQIKKGKK